MAISQLADNSATPPPTDDGEKRRQRSQPNSALPPIGFERSQQSRGDRSGAVAIVDCWLWLIMAENSFSKTIIRLRHWFALANNSHTQISRPRRHRLTNSPFDAKIKKNEAIGKITSFKKKVFAERGGFEPPKPFWGLPTFQAGQFNHSCISPFARAKIVLFAKNPQ